MWDDLKALPGWSWFDKVSWYSFLLSVAFVLLMGAYALAHILLWPLRWNK